MSTHRLNGGVKRKVAVFARGCVSATLITMIVSHLHTANHLVQLCITRWVAGRHLASASATDAASHRAAACRAAQVLRSMWLCAQGSAARTTLDGSEPCTCHMAHQNTWHRMRHSDCQHAMGKHSLTVETMAQGIHLAQACQSMTCVARMLSSLSPQSAQPSVEDLLAMSLPRHNCSTQALTTYPKTCPHHVG